VAAEVKVDSCNNLLSSIHSDCIIRVLSSLIVKNKKILLLLLLCSVFQAT